ncbi:MAG: ATP-binding protein [Ekhidna sp.]|nr:ATP-binding protein [Ekhidna sp.]
MQIDIKGKINEKKLAYSNTLLPLFEAVINSIQAIEEESATNPGIIEVSIIRSQQEKLKPESYETLPEIMDFIVEDNGIGFNKNNYDSFNYAHSRYKKGGRGIGRFSWLRAFRKAEIESKFKEDGRWQLRNFSFEPTKNGIENHSLEQVNTTTKKRYTIVKLKGLKEDYRKWCNTKAEDIALKIIEHAFIYFLGDNCPRMTLDDLGSQFVVNDLFEKFTNSQVKSEDIEINGNEFNLRIVKLYNTKKVDNKIHYWPILEK